MDMRQGHEITVYLILAFCNGGMSSILGHNVVKIPKKLPIASELIVICTIK